jgi:hypothetical protein
VPPRSRKDATDRLLVESQDLLAGVEEEPDEVTARHDIDELNGHGERRPLSGGLEIAGPGGLKLNLKGVSGVTIVACAAIGAAILMMIGHLKHWW